MVSLFVVQTPHESNLPPMDQIQQPDADGNIPDGYGWYIAIGEAPQPYSVLVAVCSTDDFLDTMAVDTSGKWLYLGELNDDTEN